MSNRFQSEAKRLLDQLRFFQNSLQAIENNLYEMGESKDHAQIVFVTDQLGRHEEHMNRLYDEHDQHEPGHLWAELNRIKNQLIYQLQDAQSLFLKYVYLQKQATTKEEK